MIDIHWRNTQKPARFFVLDARAFIAFMVFMVHARTWTLVIAIVVMIFFWILERYGLTFDASLRAIRCWFFGKKRPANARYARRRWTEYQ